MKRTAPRGAIGLGWWLGAALTVSVLCTPLPGDAQQPAADDPTVEAEESRSQAFQAVDGAVEEDIAGGPLMLVAYAFVWLVVFAYVLRLVSLQRRTLEEIAELKRIVDAAPAGPAAADGATSESGDG